MSNSPQKSAKVFISSTFIDMQQERDILSKRVFPRLRRKLNGQLDAIREIDLRWGVTEAMSCYEGAVNVCLEKISESVPVIFGMLGHRIGWCPTLDYANPTFESFLSTQPKGLSLTELELEYSAYLLAKQNPAQTVVLVRSKALSQSVVEALQAEGINITMDSIDDIDAQRQRLLQNQKLKLVSYDSFEAFERIAESELETMLTQLSEMPAEKLTGIKVQNPELARTKLLQDIGQKTKSKPTLIYGIQGAGKTWLAKQWLATTGSFWHKNKNPVYVDLRQQSIVELTQNQGLNQGSTELGLSRYFQSFPKHSRLVLDHFEDGFAGSAAADLSFIPTNVKHLEVCLCSADKSLYEQAQYLGWHTVEIPFPARDEIDAFITQYLAHYGKSLNSNTTRLLANAKWSNSFANLKLVLDELRRFGIVEKLEEYATQLGELQDNVAVVSHVLSQLDIALPERWHGLPTALMSILYASHNGLDQHLLLKTDSTESIPCNIWTTIEVSLESCLRFSGNSIDLNAGPIEAYLQNELLNSKSLHANLRTWQLFLEQAHSDDDIEPEVYFCQLPGLCYMQGETALFDWLNQPGHMAGVLALDSEFAINWLRKLPPQAQDQTLSHLSSSSELNHDAVVTLVLCCIQLNKLTLARVLCEEHDLQQLAAQHPAILAALQDVHPELLAYALSQTLGQFDRKENDDVSLAMAIYLLGQYNAATVPVTDAQAYKLADYIDTQSQQSPDSTLSAQLQLALAQFELVNGKIKSAKNRADNVIKLAKSLGHPSLLCQSLERSASIALELNRFKEAKNQSCSLIELAFNSHMIEFEGLGYERLIETHARRAEWTEAYELIDKFYQRCNEESLDRSRVDKLLEELETGRF